jgi:hypothetical protein
MLNEIMKHEKSNNSEMIEFNQVELSKTFRSFSPIHFLITVWEGECGCEALRRRNRVGRKPNGVILTYKLKRVSHADISPRRTDGKRAFRSREPSLSLDCVLAATIRPANTKLTLNTFANSIFGRWPLKIKQNYADIADRQPARKLFFFINKSAENEGKEIRPFFKQIQTIVRP